MRVPCGHGQAVPPAGDLSGICGGTQRAVRKEGLEPSRLGHRNLNPACLPIPPLPRAPTAYPAAGGAVRRWWACGRTVRGSAVVGLRCTVRGRAVVGPRAHGAGLLGGTGSVAWCSAVSAHQAVNRAPRRRRPVNPARCEGRRRTVRDSAAVGLPAHGAGLLGGAGSVGWCSAVSAHQAVNRAQHRRRQTNRARCEVPATARTATAHGAKPSPESSPQRRTVRSSAPPAPLPPAPPVSATDAAGTAARTAAGPPHRRARARPSPRWRWRSTPPP